MLKINLAKTFLKAVSSVYRSPPLPSPPSPSPSYTLFGPSPLSLAPVFGAELTTSCGSPHYEIKSVGKSSNLFSLFSESTRAVSKQVRLGVADVVRLGEPGLLGSPSEACVPPVSNLVARSVEAKGASFSVSGLERFPVGVSAPLSHPLCLDGFPKLFEAPGLVQQPLDVTVPPSLVAPDGSGLATVANATSTVPRVISYNVNGLSFYASDRDALFRKSLITRAISDFIPSCDIICLQETNLTAAERLCFSSLPGCAVSFNNFKRNTAGTLIIDTPGILKHYEPVDVFLPQGQGYVQCRRYIPRNTTHKAFQLFNCYLFTGPDKLSVQVKLLDSMRTVSNDYPTFLCGDFNFIENASDSSSETPNLPPVDFLSKFQSLKDFFSLTEVPHSDHTFFHYTSDVSSSYSYSSRLDRFYIPSSLALSLSYVATVTIKPHHSNYRPREGGPRCCFSDHLPVFLAFVADESESGNRPSIPHWLAQSPEFAASLHEVWRPPISSLYPFKALTKYKAALFKAAALTRKIKLANASLPLSLSHHITLLRLISTINQDLTRIHRLLELAASLEPLVVFREGRFWDNGLEIAAQNLLVRASAPVAAAPQPHPTTTLKEKLPGSKARISHLRCEAIDPPTFTESGKSSITARFWSKVWARRSNPPSSSERSKFLAGYTKRVDHSLLLSPSLEAVLEAIKRSNDSAAGPDGIPFAAWRAATVFAGPLLTDVLKFVCSGRTPPPGFNHGVLFLIPKKPTGLVADTRPISVTNTDNRLLASTVASLVMPAVRRTFSKGFSVG